MSRHGLVSPVPPMEHQRHALHVALAHPEAFALLMETGTGKTKVILEEFMARVGMDDIMDLLVIAPNGCVRNWHVDKSDDQPSELRRHLDNRLFRDLVVARHGGKADDRRQREKLLSTKKKPRALFINVEAFSRGKTSKAYKLCEEFMQSGRVMGVIDESTRIRSRNSERTKTIMRLRSGLKSRRIMTGLVTPKSPLNLYSQFNFLDPRILGDLTFTAFRARYANVRIICDEPNAIVDMRLRQAMGRRGVSFDVKNMTRDDRIHKILELGGWISHRPVIDSYKNLDDLQRRVSRHSFQILKDECLDLPPKIYEPRDCEMTPEQERVYREVLQDATSKLESGDHVTVSTVLAQITRLHQIVCGHVRDEEGRYHDLPSRRSDDLLEVLDEHDGKAIIWVTYERELLKLASVVAGEYGPDSVSRFWGGNLKDRGNQERRFLGDDECRFMFSTPQTGGLGNTWNVASLVVYAANSYDLEHRYQSEDRPHRIGQTKRVTYVDLVVRGTVEEKILFALRSKIDLATAVTGKQAWKRWVL